MFSTETDLSTERLIGTIHFPHEVKHSCNNANDASEQTGVDGENSETPNIKTFTSGHGRRLTHSSSTVSRSQQRQSQALSRSRTKCKSATLDNSPDWREG